MGLLSSPRRCPSGLRQLSFPGSIPLIHRPFGKYAEFSRSVNWALSTTNSLPLPWKSTITLSGLMSQHNIVSAGNQAFRLCSPKCTTSWACRSTRPCKLAFRISFLPSKGILFLTRVRKSSVRYRYTNIL